MRNANLGIGDTWNDKLILNRPRGSDFQSVCVKYRYAGPTNYRGNRVAKIVTEGTLGWGDEKPSHGAVVKVVSQENPGVIYFDDEAGGLVGIENTQKRIVEYCKNGRVAREEVNTTSNVEVNSCPSQQSPEHREK